MHLFTFVHYRFFRAYFSRNSRCVKPPLNEKPVKFRCGSSFALWHGLSRTNPDTRPCTLLRRLFADLVDATDSF